MARTNKIGTHKTTITNQDGFNVLTYHTTNIVKWNGKEIILNSGGWLTDTTKLRMNQCSNQFGLNFSVFQKDFNWFVNYKGAIFPFKDNFIIKFN